MLIYIIPMLIWVGYSFFEFYRRKKTSAYLSLLFLLPLLLIVVLRGDVGTDTAVYIERFKIKISAQEYIHADFEPAFSIFSNILLSFFNDPRVVVNVISGLNAVMLIYALRQWGGYCIFAAACIVPAYFFDFTMNGLRVGLAFPLCIFAVIAWERGLRLFSLVLFLISIATHFTALVLIPLMFIDRMISSFSFKRLLPIVLSIGFAAYLFGEYVIERVIFKVDFYEFLEKPSVTSGLFPLIVSFLLLALTFTKLNGASKWLPHKTQIVFLIIQCFFYQITLLSYAGLRFQSLALFAQLLFSQRNIFPVFKKASINQILLITMFLVFFSWKMRAFLGEGDDLISPFLPYSFFWTNQV